MDAPPPHPATLVPDEVAARYFETSGDLLLILTADTTIVRANPAWHKELGFDPASLAGRRITELIPKADRAPWLELDRSGLPGATRHFETRFSHSNGSIRWMLWALTDLGPDRSPRFLASARDFTLRKQAEDEVSSSEERFRRFYNDTPVMLQSLDRNGVLVSVSDYWLKRMGFERDEVIGQPFSKFLTEQSRLLAENERLPRFWQTGVAHDVPYQFVRKDGSTMDALVSAIGERNDRGDIVRSLAVALDISEQKRFRAELEQAGARLTSHIENSPLALIEWDGEFRVRRWSQRATALFGYTEEEVFALGIQRLGLVAEEDILKVQRLEARLLGGVNTRSVSKIRNKTKDDRVIVCEWHDSCLFDEAGQVVSVLSFVQDKTVELQLENQLRQAQKLEAIGTLVGGITHDFNNILSAIMAYAGLLRRKIDTEDAAIGRYVNGIIQASEMARNLVGSLLSFSRKRDSLEPRGPIRVGPIVDEVIGMMRATIPATVTIETRILKPDAQVWGSAVQLHQVLVNLCTNAAHAMRETGGTLTVVLDEIALLGPRVCSFGRLAGGDLVRLAVIDTGHGIPAEVQERLFDPFFTTKAAGEGSGLGLAVVSGIVADHEGAIDFTTELNSGTRFEIFLPRYDGTDEEEEEEAPAELEMSPRAHLLLADDNEAFAEAARDLLVSMGLTVSVAANVTESFELFKTDPDQFDLILTDLTMPDGTGLDLARHIRTIRPHVPIVLMSGYSGRKEEQQMHELGIHQFVMKPLNERQLRGVICEALAQRPAPDA